MAKYLVTGAAGFIGARTTELLIKDGHTVLGIDNMNNAYDPRMKEYRLRKIAGHAGVYILHNWIFQTSPSSTNCRDISSMA